MHAKIIGFGQFRNLPNLHTTSYVEVQVGELSFKAVITDEVYDAAVRTLSAESGPESTSAEDRTVRDMRESEGRPPALAVHEWPSGPEVSSEVNGAEEPLSADILAQSVDWEQLPEDELPDEIKKVLTAIEFPCPCALGELYQFLESLGDTLETPEAPTEVDEDGVAAL